LKNTIFALALVGLAFGCKSNQNTAVADPAKANMPKAECGMNKEGCSGEAKAECSAKKSCCEKPADAPQN
jgi:hypothetical protein